MNAAAGEPGNDADRGNQRQRDDSGGTRHEFVEAAAPWRLTQADDAPVVLERVFLESLIGVHGNRMADDGQQRQIVQ